MNVIFDISVLGLGYYQQKARAGIFRVIENIVGQLNELDSCNVRYCAFRSFEGDLRTRKYLRHNSHLDRSAWVGSDKGILNKSAGMLSYFYPDPDIQVSGIISILIEKLQAFYRVLDQQALEQTDIFHSPFYPLPEYLHVHKKMKKFITVYDLIPILFPQYYISFNKNRELYKIMESISPDTWVTTISESTKNDLCNYIKIEPSRVFVTYLAASGLFYRCHDSQAIDRVLTKYGIPPAPYVLSLCTLEPRKNITHTIQCFAQLIKEEKIGELNLVLVGTKGWDFEGIFSTIDGLTSLKKRLIVTGYVEDNDLAALYSGAMMFVYPSLYEGFGLPPLEAMQCGVPVITSKTSSLPEVVGDAGSLVDPKDVDALCQAMLDLYNNASLRENMSRKGINRAKLFSWQKCASETIQAYKTALSQ